MYKPFANLLISFIFIFIAACAPVNNYKTNKNKSLETFNENNKTPDSQQTVETKDEKKETKRTKTSEVVKTKNLLNTNPLNEIEIILPANQNKKIISQLINSFELTVYKKELKNISLNINDYSNQVDLKNLLSSKAKPGKIFIGTLKAEDTKIVTSYCSKGILFFSFSADKNLAKDCTYLINFFPEDDLRALFNFFPKDSKVALLYPENYYGYNINIIIDSIASKSESLIINRASYDENLSNAREAIKELGKYEIRKYELNRQKTLLEKKKDEQSKRKLNKIKRFETMGNVDFTHLILPDYSIRLLEIAPLLPFYDVDPNKVQFVGTGVWDDKIFFDEPSLQGAIFSGIEEKNRKEFFYDFQYFYNEKPIRTTTIPYDLLGVISYLIDSDMTMEQIFNFLNNEQFKFDGIDGRFLFKNNIIFRDLDILRINNGEAKKIN